MKKRNYILLFFLPLLVYFLSTCKKYPEDSSISLRTSRARLQGEWKIDRIEVNQEDVTYKYKDSLPILITDYFFWFRCNYQYGSSSKEKENVFAINKSSKKVEEAMKKIDVGGVGFYLEDKRSQFGFDGGSDRIPVKDSVAFKILFRNLIAPTCKVLRIKSLYKGKLIVERRELGKTVRIYFSKT
jgi:hypothetical protein